MIDESTCNYLKFSDSNLNDMHPKQPPYIESQPLIQIKVPEKF